MRDTVPGVEWYSPLEARTDLAGSLACVWTAVPTGRHRLVPDACMDLLWIRRDERSGGAFDEWWLCGPERTAWTFSLPPGSVAVGVRFRPGHASAVLGVDASRLLDRRAPAHTLLRAEVVDAIVGAQAAIDSRSPAPTGGRSDVTLVDRARALEAALAPAIRAAPADGIAFADAVVEAIVGTPRARQSELARRVGLTPRQLHRRTVRTFGYSTSTLARLVRFHRFLAVRQASVGPSASTALLAGLAGYADQPHLSRDCVAITGLTLRRFLDEWFPTFPNTSDPFKTTAPLASTMGA